MGGTSSVLSRGARAALGLHGVRGGRDRALFVLLGVVLPLLAFGAIALAVDGSGTPAWDSGPLRAARLLDDRDRVNVAMTAVMQASMAAAGLLAIAVAFLLVSWRRLREAVFWSLAIGGAVLLDPVLKELFRREAIGSGGEWSFPSGNAMVSMAIVAAGVVLLARSPRLKRAVVIGAALIVAEGAWLVALQWHYASDVVAGWCAAVALVSALALVLARPLDEPAAVAAQSESPS